MKGPCSPKAEPTPAALLTEAGEARRRAGRMALAEARLAALEEAAARDSVQPGVAFQGINVDGHIVEVQVRHEHHGVYTYSLVTVDRDAMLRLLTEEGA